MEIFSTKIIKLIPHFFPSKNGGASQKMICSVYLCKDELYEKNTIIRNYSSQNSLHEILHSFGIHISFQKILQNLKNIKKY